MANDEDLARLRQSAAVWNDWRAQDRDNAAVPLFDSRRVDLEGADLDAGNLSMANFCSSTFAVEHAVENAVENHRGSA